MHLFIHHLSSHQPLLYPPQSFSNSGLPSHNKYPWYNWCCYCLGVLDAATLLRFHGFSFHVLCRRQCHNRLLGPLVLTIFLPVLKYFLSLTYTVYDVDVSNEGQVPHSQLVSEFWPVMYLSNFSNLRTKMLSWWWVKAEFIWGHGNMYL